MIKTNLIKEISSAISSIKLDGSNSLQISELNDELGRNVALQFAMDMYKQADIEMGRFYSDYVPKKYNRTGGMQDNAFYPLVKKTSQGYWAGIRISTDYLDSSQYSGRPVDAILSDVYERGQHGSKQFYLTGRVKKYTLPTPCMALERYANEHIASLLSFAKSNPGNFKSMPSDISLVHFE